MITVRNEFEAVPAFEHIAGDSLGTWTERETTTALIEVLETVSQVDTARLWKDLAMLSDDDFGDMLDIQEEVVCELNESMAMPAYCHVTLQDNEWRVTPYIDEEVVCMSTDVWYEVDQNQHGFDHVYVVNDHGNVTCWEWREDKVEYVPIWAMV